MMGHEEWQAPRITGRLTTGERDNLPDSAFAFPSQRKEPLTSASHVRDAVARFMQVEDVDDAERDDAWMRIQQAAEFFGVTLHEQSWHDLT